MSRSDFYNMLEGVHALFFNDLRCGQFIDLFAEFVENDSPYSLYYISNAEIEDVMKRFISKYTEDHRWDI